MTKIDNISDVYKLKEKYKDNVSSDGVKYGEMDDGEFAYRLWEYQKDNAESLEETIPMGMFADNFNVSTKDFGKMLGYSKTVGYEPTEASFADGVIPELGAMREGLNGWTYGFGDELIGSLAAGADYLLKNDQKKEYSELYETYRDAERVQQKQYRKTNPWSATAATVGGTLLNPLTYIGGGGPAVTTTAGKYAAAGAKGFGWGTLFGVGETTKEDIGDIASEAKDVGITSSLFGMGLQRFFPGVNQKMLTKFNKLSKDPNINKLRALKNNLYKEADKSGITFSNSDLGFLQSEMSRISNKANQSILKSTEIDKALKLTSLLKGQNKKITLSHMEDLRKAVGDLYYGQPKKYEAVREMSNAVDNAIAGKTSSINKGDNILTVARLANKKYKKAQMLDDTFYQVKESLASKSSGAQEKGGVITQYKSAVGSILKDKNKSKWFDDDEIKIMEKFIEGNTAQRLAQRFSDLSLTTQGFATMMAFTGSYLQPLFLVPTMGGLVAKNIADKNIKKSAMQLLDNFGGIVRKKPLSKNAPAPGTAGALGTEAEQNQ